MARTIIIKPYWIVSGKTVIFNIHEVLNSKFKFNNCEIRLSLIRYDKIKNISFISGLLKLYNIIPTAIFD